MKWKRLALMGAASCISACLIRADDFDKELAATLKLVVMVHAQLAAAPVFGAGIVFGREKDRLYILTANHVVRRAMRRLPASRSSCGRTPVRRWGAPAAESRPRPGYRGARGRQPGEPGS